MQEKRNIKELELGKKNGRLGKRLNLQPLN